MDKVYILQTVYTSENDSRILPERIEMYPFVAGTKEGVEKELEAQIKIAKDKDVKVEEITSEDINRGTYFDRVVKLHYTCGGPKIFGICSVWRKD